MWLKNLIKNSPKRQSIVPKYGKTRLDTSSFITPDFHSEISNKKTHSNINIKLL